MHILFLFQFKRLIQFSLFLILIVVGGVWLKQSLSYIEIIVNHNISIKDYLFLVGLLIPDLLVIVLPFCALVSVLFLYNRMILNHELVILRSFGLSNWTLAKPAFALSALGMILTALFYIFIIPSAFQAFRSIEYKMRNELTTSFIQEGSFNNLRGITLYIRKRVGSNALKGVFIHNNSPQTNDHSTHPYTIVAAEGRVIQSPNGLRLILNQGYRQEKNPATNQISTLAFEELNYDLNQFAQPQGKKTVKPHELSIPDLIFPKDSSLEASTISKYKAEGHIRVLSPFILLIYILIGLNFILKSPLVRVRSYKTTFMAIVASALIQVGITMLINTNHSFPFSIYLAYLIVFSIIIFNFILLRTEQN